MAKEGTLSEIAPFVAGQGVDRVAMAARRAQLAAGAKPQGLPIPQKAAKKEPSLTERLLANAVLLRSDSGPFSMPPSDGDWVALGDLPEQIQRIEPPKGWILVGFKRSALKDKDQLGLLDSWVQVRQQQKQARLEREQQGQAMAMAPGVDDE